MLFLLTLMSTCAASEAFCLFHCREETENVPENVTSNKLGVTSMDKIHDTPWIICNDLNGSIATSNRAPFPSIPCLDVNDTIVEIRGYPFGVLSATTITNHSGIIVLALEKGEITDIEDNALAGLTAMGMLDLSYNRLTHVKQSWFTGLTNLFSLTLSMNLIVRMDPGCFQDLPHLSYLYLNGNLLRTVEPGWFLGLTSLFELILESNCIKVITAGTFQYLTKLYELQLGGNGLSRLDGGAFRGLDSVIDLGIIGAGPDIAFDSNNTIVHDIAWSLALGVAYDVSAIKVSSRIFCFKDVHDNQMFSWSFASARSNVIEYHNNPCRAWDIYGKEVKTHAPFLFLVKSDPYVEDEVRCSQAWGAVGPALVLAGGLNLRPMYFREGKAGKEILAIAFDWTQNQNDGSDNSDSATQNVTCVLLMKDSSSRLVLHGAHMFNKTYSDSNEIWKDQDGGLTSQRTPGQLPGQHITLPGQQTGQQQTSLSWTTSQPTTTTLSFPDQNMSHLFVSLVIGALFLVILVWLLVKKCSLRQDIHVNRPRVVSGRARSASLPVISRISHGDRKVSRRSLPCSLSMIEAIYCEIPDEVISATRRPLPALPHTYWEIPDDNITAVARSTPLPSFANPTRNVRKGSVPCRSLPVSLSSIEPTNGGIAGNDDDRLQFYAAATDLTLLESTPLTTTANVIEHHNNPCRAWDIYGKEVKAHAPFLFLVKSDPYVEDEVRCSQAWGAVGPALVLAGGLNLRLMYFLEGKSGKEILAIAFDWTQNQNAGSDNPDSATQNVTCVLLMKDSSSRLVLHGVHMFNKTYSDSNEIWKDQDDGLTSQTPGQQTALSGQHITLPGHQTGQQQTSLSWTTSQPTTTTLSFPDQNMGHLFVSLVLGALFLVILVWLLVKKCSLRQDIHVNRPRAVSGRARSASLPDISRISHGDRKVSRRSLPCSLSMIEAIYCEIPDEVISATRRPLSALPHTYWEIPDDNITAVARSTPLPSFANPTRNVRKGSVPSRSLPASLSSIEPTNGGIAENDDDRLQFYAAATDLTLLAGERYNTHHDSVTTYLQPHKPLTVGHVGVYGGGTVDNSHRVTFYGHVEEDGQSKRAHRTKGIMAFVSLREDQALRPYMNIRNVTEAPSTRYDVTPTTGGCLSHSNENQVHRNVLDDMTQVTGAQPNTYWSWQVVEDCGRNMQRSGSLPALSNSTEVPQSVVSFVRTLPNTYWPCQVPTNGQFDRSRPVSPIPTLPNTYWPWEVRGESSRSNHRRASLSSVPTFLCETSEQNAVSPLRTLPNTYWPWEIPTSEQLDRSRPVPPMATLPDTYWPWEIPGPTNDPQ
uniref:LRRCT domain-containing protein n=1 Tax=Branchiostoma floridae TaxID=7739 RepID=C4A0X0_BRAFL|eukprot:XP_002585548.1 hypothetical protein BRAFLDRAFT_90868 [Branchiostoma floridae]